MIDRSPIHGKLFGGEYKGITWEGRFLHEPEHGNYQWKFEFLDEGSNPVAELSAWGGTPREAFEEVISRFIYLNGNKISATLEAILPQLRSVFNESGGIKAEWILGVY